MDPVKFGALIRTLEQRSAQYPRLYRAQVGAIAAMGYGYIVAVLLLLVGSIVGLGYAATHLGGAALALKLMIGVLGLGYLVLRALWIRLPDLEGVPLPAERYPALAAAIEGVRVRLRAPRFRRVLLDGRFNAAVAQRPRFGLIGPSISDLVIGLPLMQALSRKEFEAVLAHEMGHVSREHGRFKHWIYRIRTTWSRLAEVVRSNGGPATAWLFGRFFSWYAPFFGAYSFVLARQDEYEADSAALRLAGQDAVATALVRLEVFGRFHAERHWGDISQELLRGGRMPLPHAAFVRSLAERLNRSEAERWLSQELQRPTDYADTHPCLTDRLRAIGVYSPPVVPGPPAESAAEALLGAAAEALARELDAQWRAEVEPRLAELLAQREAAKSRLQQLEGEAAAGVESLWERIELLERLDRGPEAVKVAEALLAGHPDHVPALFFVGRTRLAADDPDGIVLLERAAALHPAAAPAVQELIFEYHWRHGRREEAEAARASLARAGDRLEAAERERASLFERPVLVPHGLAPDQVERISAALTKIPGLRAAFMARRVVIEMPEVPCYLVGLVPARPWWKFRKQAESERLRDAVIAATEWPESTYFVLSDGPHAGVVGGMGKVAGALLRVGSVTASPAVAPTPTELELLRAKLGRRRSYRSRFRLGVVTAVIGIVAMVGWAYHLREEAIATTPLRQFTVAQTAQRMRDARGRVVILVLYRPGSHGFLIGDLRRWATQVSRPRVELLAMAVGRRRNAQAFFRYAGDRGLPPLAPTWLEPWPSGALDSTMAELGVRVGKTWTIPLVAVIDPEGKVVAQWQGETDYEPIIAAAKRALGR